MIRVTHCYSLALTLWLTSFSGLAQINVYALELDGLHQSDGSGLYDKHFLPDNADIKLIVLPPTRAQVEFANCIACCLSPINKDPNFYDVPAASKQSSPLNVARVYAFTAPNSPPISSLTELKGKVVGAMKGIPYGKEIESAGLNLQLANSIMTNIKKLKAKRLDAFIAYTPDAYFVFDEMKEPEFSHDKDNPLAVHPDAVVCKGVSDEFMAKLNSAIDRQ